MVRAIVLNTGRYLDIALWSGKYVIYNPVVSFDLRCQSGICNNYTMAARDFADIYTQSLRAAGPRAAGVYVSKIPSSHGTSDIYHLGCTHLIGERTNKNSPHLFYTVASED